MKLSELDPSQVTAIPDKLVNESYKPTNYLPAAENKAGPYSEDQQKKDQALAKDPLAEGDVDIGKADSRWQNLTRNKRVEMAKNGDISTASLHPEDQKEIERQREARNFLGFAGVGAAGEIAAPLIAKGVGAVVDKLAPNASARIGNRALNETVKGAGLPTRKEIGPVKTELAKISQTDPIYATPKDAEKSLEAIDSALEKRTAELDSRYQRATDKFVSDSNGVPNPVNSEVTAPVAPISPKSRQLGPEQGENPILPTNEKALVDGKSLSNEFADEPTVKLKSDNLRAKTPVTEPPVIEMRPNGTLMPHEIKASIVTKANELERSSAPQSDAVHGILKDLEREINAETKATHDDPSLRWWRQKATDYQKIANKRAMGKAENDNQAAHNEVANLIRDSLESHMKDPRVNQLNAEVSALLKLRKAVQERVNNENAPGNSPGKYGQRLGSALRHTADVMSVAMAPFSHGASLAIPAVIHGAPKVASGIDRAIVGTSRAGMQTLDNGALGGAGLEAAGGLNTERKR